MALTQLEPTLANLTSNWRGSTSTTTRLVEANMCQEPSWWIWNQEPWTASGLVLMELSFVLTTSSLDNLELGTTGPRVTTPRGQSWWTVSSMLSEKRLKVVIVFRYKCKGQNNSQVFHIFLLIGFPTYTFSWRWYWVWHGNTPHLQDQRRVS